MSNFSFLKKDKDFNDFAQTCIDAETYIGTNTVVSAVWSRRALELAIKWIYKFDNKMVIPYKMDLYNLMDAYSFKQIVPPELIPLINYVRKLGNASIHSDKLVKRDEAVVSLRNLFEFVNWIDYTYGDHYQKRLFKESLLGTSDHLTIREKSTEMQQIQNKWEATDQPLKALREQSSVKRQEITQKRESGQRFEEIYEVDKLSEAETRKYYIDVELKLAGWEIGQNVVEEYFVRNLEKTKSGTGKIDYVLLGENGTPIALVEAKRTSLDSDKGRIQAIDYAQALEKETGLCPIVFFTNGFETWMIEEPYPAREVSGFYTHDELQLSISRRNKRTSFTSEMINDDITNRPYQKEAIAHTCADFESENNRRKVLLVMATGSGKTRTAISLVDILTKNNWVKNCLFLADRRALVNQAYQNFKTLLPSVTVCNLLERDKSVSPESSRMIFSSYPTMLNAIETITIADGRPLFTPGHFDLIIIDESHRSIYKKYGELFAYFDALLVGLTATPRSEFDKNTYELFDLAENVPTFAYELDQAVSEKYLVPYNTIETILKIPERGLHYDELSTAQKEHFEDVFEDEAEELKDIKGDDVNTWLFNSDTIDKVLNELMKKGIRDSSGDKIGKTIIFAKNHNHADAIQKRFRLLYPSKGEGYLEVIDNYQDKHQSLIEDFSVKNRNPQIAVSVDMLDTGIDVPEIVNLVFFKRVRSKVKFIQMIGRGTRTCVDLFGLGNDKTHFLIFDYGRNFDFFRMDKKEVEAKLTRSVTERILGAKAEIIRELENLNYQTEELTTYRNQLIDEWHEEVCRLDDKNILVKQKLKYVHKFRNLTQWESLTAISIDELKYKVAPLVPSLEGDEMAKRFDYSIFTIEFASLAGQDKMRARMIRSVIDTAKDLAKRGTINAVKDQKDVIERAMDKDFWENATINEMEEIRVLLRNLVQFVEKVTKKNYYSHFEDEVIDVKEDYAPLLNINELEDYREKVEQFLKETDNLAVYGLRHNRPLTAKQVESLEHELWEELGTKEQYTKEFGNQSVMRLVRNMAGLEPQEVNSLFSEILSNEQLNVKQIQFIKKIIEYVTKNGYLEKEKFTQEPFKTVGSITELFDDNYKELREKLLATVDQINRNAEIIS